jgi:hypothetical protein
MKKTYLSVDIDYWSGNYNDSGMIPFLMSIIELGVPIKCVKYHHELTPIINANSNIQHLINIDYHSDYADIGLNDLTLYHFNEGTWINYLKIAPIGRYTWIYPNDECYDISGRCDTDFNPFCVKKNRVERVCWKEARRRLGGKRILKKIELEDIAEIGICVSPDWNSIIDNISAINFLKQHKLINNRFFNDIIRTINSNDDTGHCQYEPQKNNISKRIYKIIK